MKYYTGLDTLRAAMMILGTFIHAALFIDFDSSHQSIHGSNEYISTLVYFFTLFRMECFFILCGFLANMILTQKDQEYFIKNRKQRVLIPLISSLVFFLIVPNFLISGRISFELAHLWFLLCLLILSALTLSKTVQNFLNNSNINIFTLLLSIAVFTVWAGLIFLSNKMSRDLSTIFSYFVTSPLYYLIFYFLGYILFNKENLDKIKKYQTIYILLGVIFSFISIYLYRKKYIFNDLDFISQIIKTYSDFFSAITISLVLFISVLSFNYSNKFIVFLKDSSLVIYVSHFIFIMTLAPFVDSITNSSTSFYFSLCFITFVLCILTYLILKKFSLTRFLFGIK